MLKTILDVVAEPFGTARLVEGFCTLNRCAEAGLSVAQMKKVFPALEKHPDDGVTGFIDVGRALLSGQARFPADVFDSAQSRSGGQGPAPAGA